MDIYEPIREVLMLMAKAEPTNNLDKQCGIISSYYPPTDLNPNGLRVEYQFPIKPNDLKFYSK